MTQIATADAVARVVRTWLHDSGSDGDVVDCDLLGGMGFDNALFVGRIEGSSISDADHGSVVFRVGRTASRHGHMLLEAEIHRHLRDNGVRTPAIIAVVAPGPPLNRPIQIMERADGRAVLDAMLRTPWKARGLVTEMAGTLAGIHDLPLPPWMDSGDIWSISARRLRTADDLARRTTRQGAGELMAKVHHHLELCAEVEPVLCHGDFHPANVLAARGGLTVLDWTDAGIGDRHADVARFTELLRLASATQSAPARLALQKIAPRIRNNFMASYERAAGATIDPQRVQSWEVVHLAHDWAAAEERATTDRDRRVADTLWNMLQRDASGGTPHNSAR